MRTDSELAHFQSRLLDGLSQPGSAEDILRRLRADQSLVPYHGYIAGFDPRMVEVAAILVKKWGRLNPSGVDTGKAELADATQHRLPRMPWANLFARGPAVACD